ncbi:MAG TPA: CBS domain-containing protein [Casimicrobiaceae bacterium]|nr:CBS domain-containing protein [Casimicrobiaceae bacterium]
MRVKEILKLKGHTLFTAAPATNVRDAVKTMADNDIGSLVVMDHGRLIGMLTFREVLQALARNDGTLGDIGVDAILERDPLIAAPDLEVMELRRVMLERHSRYVPVMDRGTLLGVVSFHDVAKAVYEDASFENRMLKTYIES